MDDHKSVLEYLDNVELEFALSKTHEQFQKLVWAHIKNVVESLGSQKGEVVNKASVVLSHVCKRFTNEAKTKLPLREILHLASVNQPFSNSQKDVVMLILEMGYKQATLEESLETLPCLLSDITERNASARAMIIGMVFPIIANCSDTNTNIENLLEKAIIDTDVDNLRYVMSLMAILMIYEIPSNTPWNSSSKLSVSPRKVGIVNTIARKKAFARSEFLVSRILILLCASANDFSEVNSIGKLYLKSCSQSELYNGQDLARSLVDLYTGKIQMANTGSATLPIKVPLNLKISILSMLQKTKAFIHVPSSCEKIFDEILYENPSQQNTKLYIELLALGLRILNDPASLHLNSKFEDFLKIFLKRLENCSSIDDRKIERVRLLLYEIMAALCKKIGIVEKDTEKAFLKLLRGLCYEPRSISSVIRSSFMEILPIFKGNELLSVTEEYIFQLCVECINKNIPESLYCLLMFIYTSLNSNMVEFKYLSIDAIQRSRHGLKQAGFLGLELPDPPEYPIEDSEDNVAELINQYRNNIPDFIVYVGLLSSIMKGRNLYNLKNYQIIYDIESAKREKFVEYITSNALSLGLEYARSLFVLSADPWANRRCIGSVGNLVTDEVWIEETATIERMAEYARYLDQNYKINDEELCNEHIEADNEGHHPQETLKSNTSRTDNDISSDTNYHLDYLNNIGNPTNTHSKKNVYSSHESDPLLIKKLSFTTYVELLIDSLKSHQSDNLLKIICIHTLLELVNCLPEESFELMINELPAFKDELKSNNSQVYTGAAGIIGELLTRNLDKGDENQQQMRQTKLTKLIDDFLNELNSPPFSANKTGVILPNGGIKVALGSIVGRLLFNHANEATKYVDENKITQIMEILSSEVIYLKLSSASNLPSLCTAISEACRYQRIPKWSFVSQDEEKAFLNYVHNFHSNVSPQKYESNSLNLCKKLIYMLESYGNFGYQEKILNAQCDLFVDSFFMRELILIYLISLIAKASTNLVFLTVIGESICKVIFCKDSVLTERHFYVPLEARKHTENSAGDSTRFSKKKLGKHGSSIRNNDLVEIALTKLLSAIENPNIPITTLNGHLIVILCIVRLCSQEPAVTNRFFQLAELFSRYLNNSNLTMHSVESDAICHILKNSEGTQRTQIISMLRERLCCAPPGDSSPSKLDGATLTTTLQVILTLSSEFKNPELVHLLLYITLKNKSWTTRFWMRTTFFNCSANMVKKVLSPNDYEKLIVKLFILKFHPVLETCREIDCIWNELVTNEKVLFNSYRNEICDHIVSGINNNSSHYIKKCSCDAIKYFVNVVGVNIPPIIDKIMGIYSELYNIIDVVVESVKLSAFAAARTLSNTLINYIDTPTVNVTTRTEIASKFVNMLSRQACSIDIIVERFVLSTICKLQGCDIEIIRDSLITIVNTLIDHFSAFGESSDHSYKNVAITKTGVLRSPTNHSVGQVHEHSRMEEIRLSPFMSSLVKFFSLLPEDSAQEVMQRVIQLINESPKFAIKIACVTFVTQVFTAVPYEWKLNSNLVNESFFPLIKSNNNVIGIAASYSLASLCKNSPKLIQSSLSKISNIYFSESDETSVFVLGTCAHNILKYFKNLDLVIIKSFAPTAYVASMKVRRATKCDVWLSVWDIINTTASDKYNYSPFVDIIKALTLLLIDCQQPNLKSKIALSISEALSELTARNVNISNDQNFVPSLLNAFIYVLTKQYTEEKHEIISAFAKTVDMFYEYINWNESHCVNKKHILLTLINGLKSTNDFEYMYYSLLYLPSFYIKIGSGLYSLLHEPLISITKTYINGNPSLTIDSYSGRSLELRIREMAFRTIGDLWKHSKGDMAEYVNEFIDLLVKSINECVWNLQESVLDTLTTIINDINVYNGDCLVKRNDFVDVLTLLVCTNAVMDCARKTKYTESIKKTFDCLEALILKLHQANSPAVSNIMKEMSDTCNTLKNSGTGIHATAVYNRIIAKIHN